MNAECLLANYERIADAPDAIARLRRFILDLAVRGKLVPQDLSDEPASELSKRIALSKERLVKMGQVKVGKPLAPPDEGIEFDIPTSWRWTRLGSIASYIQRGKSPKYAPSDGSLVVSQKCVQWTGLDLSVAKQITFASLADYEPIRFLRNGDLLWNSTGTGTIGRIIRLVEPPDRLVCDSHVTVVRCLEVDPEFVRTWLRSDSVYAMIEERAAGSTNQVELTAQMAINQVVPLPPLAEQRRIVAKVDELMALCDRLEVARAKREATRDRLVASSLARLKVPNPETFPDDARFVLDALPALTARPDEIKQLRQAIVDLAVRGKLVPQDPKDEPAKRWLQANVTSMPIADQQSGAPRLSLPVGWNWIRVADVFEVAGGIQKTPSRAPRGNAFPYLGVGNVYRGRLDLGNVKKFELELGEIERRRLVAGDLLIIEGNGSFDQIGRCAKWSGEIPDCVHQNHVIRCRPFDTRISDFVLLFLNSQYGMQIMQRLAITSSGLYSLSVGKIRKIEIPMPPLAEQRRIVAKVDELMGLCDRLESSLSTSADTRRRLLDALLSEALAPDKSEGFATESLDTERRAVIEHF